MTKSAFNLSAHVAVVTEVITGLDRQRLVLSQRQALRFSSRIFA